MSTVNDVECAAAGLDPQEVARVARGLERYAKQARALGLTIFGSSGNGSLRFDDGESQHLVVAEISTPVFDGGDGAARKDADGLLRGE